MGEIHEPLGDDTVLTHTLKAARDDKSKRLMDTTEVVPVTKHFKIDFFRSLLREFPLQATASTRWSTASSLSSLACVS